LALLTYTFEVKDVLLLPRHALCQLAALLVLGEHRLALLATLDRIAMIELSEFIRAVC